jgi:hypothetical protein
LDLLHGLTYDPGNPSLALVASAGKERERLIEALQAVIEHAEANDRPPVLVRATRRCIKSDVTFVTTTT